MPLKPSNMTFGCVSSECSIDRAELQEEQTICMFGNSDWIFRLGYGCSGTVTGFSDWAEDVWES